MAQPEPAYGVLCSSCGASFDALGSAWCECLVTERTLVCPSCQGCFCKAPPSYRQRFWAGAPRALWDRKFTEHHSAHTPPLNPDPQAATRPLVLLVDDERDIQRVASKVISSLGYGLVVARNGEEGLELTRRYRPDLVLSDALMPKLDGREMCRLIKQDPVTAGVKVVVMTALFTSPRYRAEAFKTFQVDDYLSKPLDLTQLRALLLKHLG
jgi:CheY-like chemotaxis protein